MPVKARPDGGLDRSTDATYGFDMNQSEKPPPRDFRREVTDDIIRMLEEGTTPWQKPWQEGELGRSPFNPTTNRPYRGGNVLGLMIAGMRKGYTDPRWLTYKQAADHGWQVRKGEKATGIEFWEIGRGKDDEGDSDAEKPRSRMIHRVYSVFNAQQIDGIPALELPERKLFEVIQAGEDMLRNSGAAQFYLMGLRDSEGEMLRGKNNYRFRVPADVPVDKFWSVIVYSQLTKSFVPNPLDHFGLDSYEKSKLKRNADNSVDIYIGNDAPKGFESNWLPSAGQDFFVIFRLYGPAKSFYEKTWEAPDIERVK